MDLKSLREFKKTKTLYSRDIIALQLTCEGIR